MALARRGCALTLLGRDLTALERVAEELSEHGGRAEIAALDLGDAPAVDSWIAHHRAALGELDLLVNNAAWADASPFLESEPGAERAAMETNALAPMALARRAAGRAGAGAAAASHLARSHRGVRDPPAESRETPAEAREPPIAAHAMESEGRGIANGGSRASPRISRASEGVSRACRRR